MKFTPLIALAAALILTPVAYAADTPAPTAKAAGPSSGQLGKMCGTCEWVTEVRSETRNGHTNGVGAAGGAVAGGVIGHKAGDSTVATVGGAVIGGLIGNEIEKRVKKHRVWIVSTTRRDGSKGRHELGNDPQLHSGDVVRPDGQGLKRQ